MANRVDIDIYANDKTGGTLNNIEGKFSDLEGGFQALTGISLTTAGVIAAIGGGISAAVRLKKQLNTGIRLLPFQELPAHLSKIQAG